MSKNNNNGKVLSEYLSSFKNEELCQFYTANEEKNVLFPTLNITDLDVLNKYKLMPHKTKGQTSATGKDEHIIRKTPFKQIIRFCLWNFSYSTNKKIKKFFEHERPTHICLFLGDTPHLIKIAYKLSKKYKLKLIVFCGEDYTLKKYNYIQPKKKRTISFLLFMSLLKRMTRKLFNTSDLVIFNSNDLRQEYSTVYSIKKSAVYYQTSSLILNMETNEDKNVLYTGNLSLGRDDTLVEFSKALYLVDSNYTLDVYGNATESSIRKFAECPNIRYFGYVDYDTLISVISKSSILLHVEKNTPYNIVDLKHAFSTKIADLILSNKKFIFYAPAELFETKYMKMIANEYVSTSYNELIKTIKNVLTGKKVIIKKEIIERHQSSIVSSLIKKDILEL